MEFIVFHIFTTFRSSQMPSLKTKFESPKQRMSFTPDTEGPSHLDSSGPACLEPPEGAACLEPQQFQVSPENTKLCIDTSSSSDDDLEMPGNFFYFILSSI
jgi:hypothetical protein